jgi:serine/threonine-protein kinase RsbW
MITDSARSRQKETVFARQGPDGSPWRLATVLQTRDVIAIHADMTALLEGLDYSVSDRRAVRLALEEAIVNGVRHGNLSDPTKCVRVRYCADREAVMIEVEDEGPGFDPDRVADPTLAENLGRPGGRGLFLMRYFMTWVCFSGRGNRVMLCKRRSP